MTDRFVRVASVALLTAAFLAGRPSAQEPDPATQQPTFRTRVDSISVDAVVTDRQGRPITDLTAQDFEIREGGRLQTIDTFRLIETGDGFDDPAAAREILTPGDHERETARADNRLLVIFLDDYHVRRQNSWRVREQVARFVRELSPHDLVAVATPLLSGSNITFSRNHEAVASTIRMFEGRKYDYTPKHPIEQQYWRFGPEELERIRNDLTIASLRNLCEYLGTLRDGRKTVLFVSEGLTGQLPPGVRVVGSPDGAMSRGVPTTIGNSFSQNYFETVALNDQMQKIFTAAARTNTAIYSLDARGLAASEFDMGDAVNAALGRQFLNNALDSLRLIAEQTDGRAILNQNDAMADLKQMVREGSTYYLLSYTSSVAPRDGKFHEIQVRVKRRDVDVRARKGYWAYTTEEVTRLLSPPKAGPSAEVVTAFDELATAVESGRGRAVTAWIGAQRGAAEEAQVTFTWEGRPTSAVDESVDRVAVTVTSQRGNVLFSGQIPREAGLIRPAGQARFDAPPGPIRVRITAENARGRTVDSSEASFEVPDFTAVGPVITAPFVYRGRTARDLQQVRAAATPLPTAGRTFSRTERLLLRFASYGPGGTSPAVSLRLLNKTGESITALPSPTRLGEQQLEAEVSLGTFPPGDYLIEIAADGGGEDAAKRLLAIRVTG